MKQKKKPGSRALALGIWMLCMLAVTQASERDVLAAGTSTKDDFEYDKRGAITKYTGNASEVVIPEGTVRIEASIFDGCEHVTSVIIPKTVYYIGLETNNGHHLFGECPNLEEIVVAKDNPYFDSRNGCNAIITKDGSLIAGCKNTTIPLDENGKADIVSIDNGAFEGQTGLKSLTHPGGSYSVGTFAFSGYKDFAIYVKWEDYEKGEYPTTPGGSGLSPYVKLVGEPSTNPGSNSGNNSGNNSGSNAGSNSGTPAIPAPTGTNLKDTTTGAKIKVTSADIYAPTVAYVAPKSKNTSKITIPASVTAGGVTYKVTSIADNAFKGNKKITQVTIPNTVKTVGKNTFKNCIKLTKVTMGTGVTKIQPSAFEGCKVLKTVTVKSTKLSTIGTKAFKDCKKLQTVTLKTTKLTKSSIGKDAFKGTKKNLTIKVPKTMVRKYKTYFRNKGNNTLVIKK